MQFATAWMEQKGIMLSEISQKKDKYKMTSLVYGI